MEGIKKITIEDAKKDDKLLQKMVNHYNTYLIYKEKNRDKYNEYSRNYYYKLNKKGPKKEKKTEDIKEYQRQYRQKLKEKRELLKQQQEENNNVNQ